MAAHASTAVVAAGPNQRDVTSMKTLSTDVLDALASGAGQPDTVDWANAPPANAGVAHAFEALGPWLEYVDQALQHLLVWQHQREDDRFNIAELLHTQEALEATRTQPRGMPHWSTASGDAPPWTTLCAPVPCGRLANVIDRFGLTHFETQVLVLCLLPLIEPRYRALIAYLQGDEGASWPGVELALTLFSATPVERIAHRHQLYSSAGSLLLNELVHTTERNGRACARDDAAYLRVNETVFRYLSGADAMSLPMALTELAQWHPTSHAEEALRHGAWAACAEQIAMFCFGTGSRAMPTPLLLLQGGDGSQALIAQLASEAGRPTLSVNLRALPDDATDAWPLLLAALREARLHGGILVLQHVTEGLSRHRPLLEALEPRLARHGQPIVCLLPTQETAEAFASLPKLRLTMPPRMHEDNVRLLQAGLGTSSDGWDLAGLLKRTRVNPDTLTSTLQEAQGYRALRGAQAPLAEADLCQALRVRGQQHFGQLAQRMQPQRTLDDLIVNEHLREQLHEILAAIRQRDAVLTRGFARKVGYGTGISALFYGESGTGKSMAAEVLAGELGLDLIRVDLSTVVNKYVGETEKNLSQIFDLAVADTGVLLFDEADALFGKRSEVKDAQDRHANIEVSYLLQRLEQYPGLVVLTTNNRAHLDDAFTRRLTFITRFETPNAVLRERMWRAIWPEQVAVDQEVDFARFSAATELTGAGIRNVALLASWLAAEEDRAVSWVDIARAVRRELSKTGRIMPQL
ncbi:ATP-binding protein [Mycetohabitans endofungorum]|nr:ATP-binding protein [Mycetohabitans sp. B3]